LAPERQAGLVQQLPKVVLDFQALIGAGLDAEACRRLPAPTCLLAGTTGPLATRRVIEVLHELLPGSQHHLLPAGHMAPVPPAALVNPLLETFIRSVDARAR